MSDEGNAMEPKAGEPPRHWYLHEYYHVESTQTCACETIYGPLKWAGTLRHKPGGEELVHVHEKPLGGNHGRWEATMEPFTPTTEQVRAAYVRASRQAFIAATSEHEAEFERWLAATVAAKMHEDVIERNQKAIEKEANGPTIQEGVAELRKLRVEQARSHYPFD